MKKRCQIKTYIKYKKWNKIYMYYKKMYACRGGRLCPPEKKFTKVLTNAYNESILIQYKNNTSRGGAVGSSSGS